MNKLEARIDEIRNKDLGEALSEEVKQLKKEKNFGLVFEEHLPEVLPLFNAKVKRGSLVSRGSLSELFRVISINENEAECICESDNSTCTLPYDELVVVKKFGEVIYPALLPLERVERGEVSNPNHVLIESDNYHALQLLEYMYAEKVDAIYIDPPYNTGAKDWKYNNDFVDENDSWRHSKWLSFMKRRLKIAKNLLIPNGVICVTIDWYEIHHLRMLMEQILPEYEIYMTIIEHNHRGRVKRNFAITHEYALWAVKKNSDVITKIKEKSSDISRNLRRTGTDSLRGDSPSLFYGVEVEKDTLKILSVTEALDKNAPIPVHDNPNTEMIWPIDREDIQRRWYYGRTRVIKEANNTVWAKKIGDRIEIHYFQEGKDKRRKSVWVGPQFDASTYGSELLTTIIGQNDFPYPKSIYAVKECIEAMTDNKDAIVLDFFAGSGTTLNAVALMNEIDGGNRQCILVSNNEVSNDDSVRLKRQGLYPGHPDYESHGVVKAITFPRSKNVILGQREDGTPLENDYFTGVIEKQEVKTSVRPLSFTNLEMLSTKTQRRQLVALLGMPQGKVSADVDWLLDDSCEKSILFDIQKLEEYCAVLQEFEGRITEVFIVMKQGKAFNEAKEKIIECLPTLYKDLEKKLPLANGFNANLQYFKLEYLDPTSIELGRKFKELLPTLWMMAGATGPIPTYDEQTQEKFLLPEGCRFAVLLDETAFYELKEIINSREDLTHVFIITDSDDGFLRMREELGKIGNCIHLYKNYLENFYINKGG
ncbi:site-specific DNA-methyltransferase [Priestia megaterium]|uniref:site-specific DNA-methyltransferase n=1 Tax=Priestia megaterium TaxID=1404 RepID=UPI00345884B5